MNQIVFSRMPGIGVLFDLLWLPRLMFYIPLTTAVVAGSMATPLFADPPAATQPAGAPVSIPNARQYDLTSKINGQKYRLFIYIPANLDLQKPQPIVYLLDGSYYFGTATDAVSMNHLTGIVVGIGYPTDDREEVTKLRTYDLSLPNASGSKKYGGGDDFLRVIDEEIKPFVADRFKVDPAHQALLGHSLGGLMVVRELFRNPQAYTTYIAASPSIWWNSRAVLADENAFDKRAKSGELHLQILITSATDEQYHGDDARKLAAAQKGVRMIDNATELATRLSALNPKNVKVTRELINDETHVSGAIASIVRGLRFALPTAN